MYYNYILVCIWNEPYCCKKWQTIVLRRKQDAYCLPQAYLLAYFYYFHIHKLHAQLLPLQCTILLVRGDHCVGERPHTLLNSNVVMGEHYSRDGNEPVSCARTIGLFWVFFNVRLLSVLCGHSAFSSRPQRPMTSDFEGLSIPDFIHYIYFPILILEKEPVFALFNVQC